MPVPGEAGSCADRIMRQICWLMTCEHSRCSLCRIQLESSFSLSKKGDRGADARGCNAQASSNTAYLYGNATVYIYKRDHGGNGYVQSAVLPAPDGSANFDFGRQVRLVRAWPGLAGAGWLQPEGIQQLCRVCKLCGSGMVCCCQLRRACGSPSAVQAHRAGMCACCGTS